MLSTTSVVALAVALLITALIVVDVSCYFVNACGLTMCISVHVCGRQAAADAAAAKPASDKDTDDPER